MKVGINGFGRIGRAIFRIMWEREGIDCVSINEPNATIDDMVYFLKYDSLYGRFNADVKIVDDDTIRISRGDRLLFTRVTHYDNVADFCFTLNETVYVIEANGKNENIEYYYTHPNRKALFTFSSPQIPLEIILGVNDNKLLNCSSNIISGSICDTVAIAPVLKVVFDNNDIDKTIITTMHPALSYQKVIDNYPSNGIGRSLGRQYIDSIIPKRTSAESVLREFYPDEIIHCLSFRVPTESVCAAEITFIADKTIDLDKIIHDLKNKNQVDFCQEELVSIDFKSSTASATIDMRWTEVIDHNVLRMMIWYDNEFGYSSKIIDLLDLWDKTESTGV